ncbi:outer membrane protein [Mesorhizobium sp. NPDC059025]|uniref:outer membrane protein n=1 Tax=unclassified Mesorhizobium TaxID=325217 RepID=UPI0036701FF7
MRDMLKILWPAVFSFSIGMTSVAFAADLMTDNSPPEPALKPVFSWTGFYAGVSVGGGFGGNDEVGLRSSGVFLGSFGTMEGSGFIGGGQIGYNQEIGGNWVVGLETDFQGANIKDSVVRGGVHSSSKINWFGTVRPRVGYIYGSTLLYGTGGLAYGNIAYRIDVGGISAFDASKTKAGWTLGGGIEHAFTDHISAKLEYQYVDFGKYTISGTGLSTEATPDFHSVRVGLNYKF